MKFGYLLFLFIFFTTLRANSGIVLNDLNGNKVDFDDYIGKKVVLLNFWATWCAPCKKELPVINKIYQKYEKKGFVILSVSLDESSEFSDVEAIAKSMSLKFPVILDPNSKASDYYNPSKNAPYSILFSADGKKVKTFLGFTSSDEEELENLIKSELAKKSKGKKSDFSWRFSTLDTYTRYFKTDTEPLFSNYEFLTTRTQGALFYKSYTLSVSFHTNGFLSTTRYIRERYDEDLNDYRIEKIYFSGHFKKQNYTLGDFHVSQGKGIALSLKKEDDLGIDTTLFGADFDLNYRYVNLELFGGFVNNTNLDIDNNDLYEDKKDRVFGASLSVSPSKNIKISTNYNYIAFNEPSTKDESYREHNMAVAGGNIELTFLKNNIKFYFEGDYIIDNIYDEEDNYAFYSSLFYTYKKFIFTQEFKRYKNFRFGFKSEKGNNTNWTNALESVFYNNPPTLERTGEKVKDVADDIWGIRSNLKYKYSENLKPYINYLYSMSYHHNDRRVHHLYFGSEYYFNDLKSKIDFSVSLRKERDLIFDDANKSYDVDDYYGFEFDTGFYVLPYLSFDFKGHVHFTQRSIVLENRTDDFHDFQFMSTVVLFKDFFISHIFDRYNYEREVGSKHNYNAYEFKYRFWDDNYFKVFYGSVRGGVKCIGGVCKDYPEFNGFKTEILLSF